MELQEINKILSFIPVMVNDYGQNPYKKVLDKRDGNLQDSDYGSQGESDTITRVYDLSKNDLFLKIELSTDSYGNNESVSKIEFVKPVVKQVTDFETV